MAEPNVAAESAVEAVTTQDNSPQSEEATIQPKTEETQASDLPADTEEQRRAFQEMRQEIKQLKEEKEAREKSESAFEAFRPKVQPNQHETLNIEDFVDPVTQVPDWSRYNQAVNTQLQQAKSLAAQAQTSVSDQLDEYQARQKYPDLFADAELEQEIADRWFAAKMRGENVKVAEVAAKVAKRFEKAVTKAEKQGAEKMLQEVTQKEQAAFAAAGQTSQAQQATSDEELERLRVLSRGRGRESEDAIAARIKGVPYQE